MIIKLGENKGNEIGNKAKFLSDMKSNGFNVPNGFVLDKDTYQKVIRENNLDDEINNLLNVVKKENVSEISNRILNVFQKTKIPEEIKNEINKYIDETKKYAVRSSGMKEDLEHYSFAGQYETMLNVQGIDNIETAIVSCYKSMFSETVLSYLINNKIKLDDLYMSVIIQEMVDSEYSGVAFTLNPLTGNDKQMLIEIAPGLGENLVSGKAAPEQYNYNWYDESIEVDEKNKYIDAETLKRIGEEFSKIQLYFGYPCDIEFALKDNQLFILQARKITSLKYLDIKDMWSTADFKDGGVSATVCTPYMWSLYEYIWEFTLRKFMIDSKILKESDLNRKLGEMFYGRCYWNMSAVKLAMSKVIGYKEREFDSEYGVKINYEGDGQTTKVTPGSLIRIARIAIAQRKILKERNLNAENYKSDLLTKYENCKKHFEENQIEDIEKEWYQLTKKTYLQSEATYFWQIFINTIHQSLYKDGLLKYVSESDYLTLLGSIDNISHLLPFYDMWNVTRKIRQNEEDLKYWENTAINQIANNMEDTKYCMPQVKQIIDKYGYHSDKELDVTYPCYYEDKLPIITNIKEMVILDDKYSPLEDKKNGQERYEKILKSIKEQVNKRKFNKIKIKVENMRKMLWWREEFRDVSTRFYYLIRVYTISLAKHYKKVGVLKDIDDIWFIRVSDLWDFIDKKKTAEDLNALITKNKKYYNSYRNYLSENEIGNIFSTSSEKQKNENAIIKGLAANTGTVKGTARVIEDFNQIDRLKENDILITKFTDTGWTPKFAILSGIVTEYGGILCHAAIVAREYGIPAIVSCHEVMKKIKDGDIITIDGATGIITIEK
ncbi:MAG: phosphoenolpyruvate synthase [Clostridia bacterium]|nr:phosphoenolpyruvate synthase [Clostridia bacterium]